LTLVENLQREEPTPKEEAAALEVLVPEARGWTTRQVGETIKRPHIYVSRRLRVFDDPGLAPLVLERKLAISTAEEPASNMRPARTRTSESRSSFSASCSASSAASTMLNMRRTFPWTASRLSDFDNQEGTPSSSAPIHKFRL
jgi:hypothetical protein